MEKQVPQKGEFLQQAMADHGIRSCLMAENHRKSKHSRKEALKKDSETVTPILRDQAKKAQLCNCDQGAPVTTPNLPTLQTKSSSPNFSISTRNVTSTTRPKWRTLL